MKIKTGMIFVLLGIIGIINSLGCSKDQIFRPAARAMVGTINNGRPFSPTIEGTNEIIFPDVNCPIMPLNEVPFTINRAQVTYRNLKGNYVKSLGYTADMTVFIDPDEDIQTIGIRCYNQVVFDHIAGDKVIAKYNADGIPIFDISDDEPLTANISFGGKDIHGNPVEFNGAAHLIGEVIYSEAASAD